MTWATYQEWVDAVADLAADDPLYLLREIPDHLPPDILDACAIKEPAAALLYAADRLTPERRAECERSAQWGDLRTFRPDNLERERRELIKRARAG